MNLRESYFFAALGKYLQVESSYSTIGISTLVSILHHAVLSLGSKCGQIV